MRQMMIYLWITSCFLLNACKGDFEEETYPPEETTITEYTLKEDLEVRWVKRFNKDQYALQTLVLNDKVVFAMSHPTDLSSFVVHLLALDKSTGDTVWVWEEGLLLMKDVICYDDKLYFYSSSDGLPTCVDANTGKKLWQWDDGQYREINGLVPINGRIYTSAGYGHRGVQGFRETRVISLDPNTGTPEIEFIFNTDQRDGHSLSLYEPMPWKHPNGDLIIFYNASAVGSGINWYPRYIAANITADSIYFDLGNYFEAVAKGGVSIYGDKVYFGSSPTRTQTWKTGCINMLTKEVEWVNELTKTDPSAVKPIKMGNRILMNPGNTHYTNCLNASTGELEWTNTKCGKRTSDFLPHNGIGWIKSGEGIIGLDPMSGEIVHHVRNYELHEELWKQKSEGWTVAEFSSFSIDQQTGWFYSASFGEYFTCFRFKK